MSMRVSGIVGGVILAGASMACGAELLVPEQYGSINDAIAAASSGDIVSIAPGEYRPAAWDLGGVAYISGKHLHLMAREGLDTVTINGNHQVAGILIDGSSASGSIIENVTVVNAQPGIWVSGAAVELRNVTIATCAPQAGTGIGGGLRVQGAEVLYQGGEILGCTATAGGGALIDQDGVLVMQDTVMQLNQAVLGGGVYVQNGYLEMHGCELMQNSAIGAYARGGAIYVEGAGSAASFTDGQFIDNQAVPGATLGGAIYTSQNSGGVSLQGCFMALNQASTGGGICALAPLAMELCVLVDNQAGQSGGAVYAADGGVVDACEFVANAAENGAALHSESTLPLVLSWNIFCADPPSAETVTGPVTDGGQNVWACVCPADVNASNQIEAADLVQMMRWFGSTCVQCQFDLDDDQMISVSDLLLLLDRWGSC